MTAEAEKNFQKAFNRLTEIGFLLVSGSEIPDVRQLITGTRSKGSWWADPAAHKIFAVNERLEDHADVTITKLISGKVTFVHRNLWHELFAVASAREDWQLRGLSVPAKSLLREVEKAGELFTNKISSSVANKPGDAARELELKLLIHSEQIHTESGSHAKMLETWDAWAKRVNFKYRSLDPSRARHFFEKRLDEVNKKYSGWGRLPWPPKTP
jgi:hypothetical protein